MEKKTSWNTPIPLQTTPSKSFSTETKPLFELFLSGNPKQPKKEAECGGCDGAVSLEVDNVAKFSNTETDEIIKIQSKMKEMKRQKELKNVYQTPPSDYFPEVTSSPTPIDILASPPTISPFFSQTPPTGGEEKEIGKNITEPYENAPQNEGFEDMNPTKVSMRDVKKKFLFYVNFIFDTLNGNLYFLQNNRGPIDRILNRIVNPYLKFCDKISKTLKLTKNTDDITNIQSSDKNTIKTIIFSIFSFPFSVFFLYNWYYLVVVRYDVENQTEPNLIEKKYVFEFQNELLHTLMNFFFGYCVKPVDDFNWFLLNIENFPKYFNMIPYENLKKFLLFTPILIISNFKAGPLLSVFCGISIFIKFGRQFMTDISPEVPEDAIKSVSPTETKQNSFDVTKKMQNMRSNAEFRQKKLMTVVYWVYLLFLYTAKFIIAFFSIFISSFMITIYWFVHSLFGIYLYEKEGGEWKGELTAFFSFGNTLSIVDQRCKNEIYNLSDPCDETFLQKLLKFVLNLFNENMFLVTFIMLLTILITYAHFSIRNHAVNIITSTLLMISSFMVVVKIIVWIAKYVKRYVY